MAGGKSIRKPPAAPSQRFHLKWISMFACKIACKTKIAKNVPNIAKKYNKKTIKVTNDCFDPAFIQISPQKDFNIKIKIEFPCPSRCNF